MDCVEAALAFGVFVMAALLTVSVTVGVATVPINAQLSQKPTLVAQLVAGAIATANGNSSAAWLAWKEGGSIADAQSYSLPRGTALRVSAACVRATAPADASAFGAEEVWSKAAGFPPSVQPAGRALMAIPLDDGTIVILEVAAL